MPLSNTWTPSLTCTLSDITISGLSVNLNGTYTKVDDYNTAPSWVIDYGLLSNTEPGYVFIRTYNSNNYIIEVTQRTSSTWVWGVFNTTTELWEASGANTYTNSTLLPCPSGQSWVLLSPPTADLFTMAAEGGGFETPGLGNGGFYGYNYSNSPEVLASKNYGLNIGSRRSVNVITPTFDRDFVTYGTLNHGTGPNITFTRASSATVFTSTGILSTVPNDVPRFEWGSFRTNYIRNSTMAGAIVGNPGTVPTNWSSFFSNATGVSAEVIATGTTSGFNYIDIKLSGTIGATTASPQYALNFETTTAIIATSGQTWTGSAYIALIGGSLTGLNDLYIDVVERSATGTYLLGSQTNIYSAVNSTLQRYSSTRLFNQPTVGRTSHRVVTNLIDGQNLNATFRIAAPQLELSSAATAFIPTTNAPVTTGVPLGLLIEESRTNYLKQSEDMTNAAWTKLNTTCVSGDGIAGRKSFIISDNSDSYAPIYQTTGVILLTGTPYTFSTFVKKAPLSADTAAVLSFETIDSTPAATQLGIYFLPTTGQTAIYASPAVLITNISNISAIDLQTYYKVSFTATLSTVNPLTLSRLVIYPAYGGINKSSSATLSGSIEVAGIQVEQGSFPTSYIPTADLSATRAADIAAVTPVTTFVNQDQGTMYTEYSVPLTISNDKFPRMLSLSNGQDANEISFLATPSNQNAFVNYFNNSIDAFLNFGALLPNTIYDFAGAYRYNDFAASRNGVSVITDSTASMFGRTLTILRLGTSGATSHMLNGYLRKVTYWPTRLSNNRLRTLTLSA